MRITLTVEVESRRALAAILQAGAEHELQAYKVLSLRSGNDHTAELLEVMHTVAELADDAANYLTGEVILPCDEGNAVAEGLATLAMRTRAAIAAATGVQA